MNGKTLGSLILVFAILAIAGLLFNLNPGRSAGPEDGVFGDEGADLSTRYRLTEEDDGEIFVYRPATRFTLVLPRDEHPETDLDIAPTGMLGRIAGPQDVAPGEYGARFETVRPGLARIRNGDFDVSIRVVE